MPPLFPITSDCSREEHEGYSYVPPLEHISSWYAVQIPPRRRLTTDHEPTFSSPHKWIYLRRNPPTENSLVETDICLEITRWQGLPFGLLQPGKAAAPGSRHNQTHFLGSDFQRNVPCEQAGPFLLAVNAV